MAYGFGSGDFRILDIQEADDLSKTYDVEPITSGFGDFGVLANVKHTVGSGDTLGTISSKYYGTTSKYLDIYNANLSVMSKGMNYLEIGWVLTIPNVDVAGSAAPAAAPVSQPSFLQSLFSNTPLAPSVATPVASPLMTPIPASITTAITPAKVATSSYVAPTSYSSPAVASKGFSLNLSNQNKMLLIAGAIALFAAAYLGKKKLKGA